jgi:hypothetical protein
VGALARVFESAGLATVGLSLVREQAEAISAPRFLHCEFPLGRPLGKPDDPEFQTAVLRRAFALLQRTDVPVLVDHPDVIEDESGTPATCTLPPRHDPTLHPAVDEAMGLRPAYNRTLTSSAGRTAVGRIATPDTIPELVAKFVELAAGATLSDVGLDADSVRAAGQDIRAYYEEAGLALSDHVPAARQIETWLYTETQTGQVIKAASNKLKEAGIDRSTWFYLLPSSQA